MRPYCRTREQSDIIRAISLPNAQAKHIFKTFSGDFRDILQTMSYASRSHRGRDRRVTVAFEHCFYVLTCKDTTLVVYLL